MESKKIMSMKSMFNLGKFFVVAIFAITSLWGQIPPQGFAPIVNPLLGSVVSISALQKNKSDKELDNLPSSLVEEFMRQLPPSLADEILRRRGSDRARPRRKAYALGSGFVIEYDAAKKEAYIVTNDHIVESAKSITVHLKGDDSGGTEIKAELIGHDPRTDIALVKIKTDIPLVALKWADSDAIQVGEWAIAVGNPFGLGNTVTVGVVSHHGRDIPYAEYVKGFIQTDAPVNTGNSGGPLFNIRGEVIGVIMGRVVPGMGDGVGFAIPANVAKKTIQQLRKFGRTKRGWIGIGFQGVTKDVMKALKRPDTSGALIGSITPGGPAEKAGLKRGDLVVRFGDKKVKDVRALPQLVGEQEVGAIVEVEVIRDGKPIVAKVTLGEFEKAQKEGKLDQDKGKERDSGAPTESQRILGMKLANITDHIRGEYELEAQAKGVVIVSVNTASEAFEVGLRPGDVIESINYIKVKNIGHVARLIKKFKKEKTLTVLLSVKRYGKEMPFITLSLEDSEKDDEEKESSEKDDE